NANYIEPRRFLKDISSVVLERVQDTIERHNCIKVNTIFNGEFATGDKRANKSINTKNYELFQTSNLHPRDDNVGHFAWIKNLSRLMSKQLNKHNGQKYICDRNDNKWLNFNNYNRKERVPFVVYADLECILEKTDGDQEASTLTYHHHHQVFSIGYYVRCSYDNSLSKYRFRRDPDCVSWFVEELRSLAHSVKKILVANVPMETLSSEQRETLHSATHCHVCEKPFAPDDNRVRDHCHLTGRYRGPAHSNCNLNYKNSYFIPIVFHNLSGYDSHFIIKEIATAYEGSIELLPITKEKYISFTKNVKDNAERSDSRNNIKTMKRDIARFDTSDYPANNAYGISLANKKILGLMKDENNGMIMTEFVGLKAKMYALKVDGKKDTKKAKGVKNNVVARMITFDDYTRCLNEEIEMTRRQSCIRSKLHEVYTISETKIALSPYDDKRYVVPNTTETLPWGHWRIPL
ncbi:hypothetical protein ALC57_00316, partial [Trachymyrmex cornetzi]